MRIKIQDARDVHDFREQLIALKKGSYLRDQEIDAISTNLGPTEFVRALMTYCVSGDKGKLSSAADKATIDRDRFKSLADFLLEEYDYEELLSLQHKVMPQDRPEILYDIGDGNFEPLNKLSVGQKATAMLIIAMSDGAMPIVIDQPEDSLDIRTVWDDMCMKVRDGKERRQFIFTTHNSSLAVASDTDNFIVLEGGAARGRVVHSGSMDHGPMNDEVMKYLEGGVPTYWKKYLKYDAERRRKETE